ncbi:L-lactate permease [Thalassospira profundimaris]|uniref:L-lactate permease n=1 Tax=Thalassospira profundimaris TaxID=502049 RepID=UPI000287298E|nr:L-lactate permease [Thalassospira profundimaris]EKF07826.1 lactate permease family protein [Thalassospira profundimaris WP0211]
MTNFLLAALPIATILFLMIKVNWGAARAGAAAWFVTVILAVFFFGAPTDMLIIAQAKGVMLALYILYIVWAALILYFAAEEAGAIKTIGRAIRSLTDDRPLQLLILGYVFASFLQGVAGFGVPIAVVAPLLLGMGFSPVLAVAAPMIGHSWSVLFGNMATSFEALIGVTGIPGTELTHYSAILLGLSGFMCGAAVLWLDGGFRTIRRRIVPLVLISCVMGVVQYFMANYGVWTLGGLTAGIAGLVASIIVTRFWKPHPDDVAEQVADDHQHMPLIEALTPYLVFIVLVTMATFVPAVEMLLGKIRFTLDFPETATATGWVIEAESAKAIAIFGHPGALLLYTAAISFTFFKLRGHYDDGIGKRIWQRTLKSGLPTSIGMVPVIGLAIIMDHAGMTYALAEGGAAVFSGAFAVAYPVIAPAIGALGAFMTGSTNNSNVVFGMFQRHTAELSGLSTALVLAAQATGASLGSMLAPSKILVGCSTVGLSGKEGPVLSVVLKTGVILTALCGFMALGILLITTMNGGA